MDKNKIIILALIVVIAALLVGVFVIMPNMGKQDTKLTLKNNVTLTQGDSLKIKLTNLKENSIANQTVNITITDKDNHTDHHSLVTDFKGTVILKMDKNPGKYEMTISYGGNEKYNGDNITKVITIKSNGAEEASEEPATQQSTQSSGSSDELYYDAELNVYYNSEGITVDPDGEHWHGAGYRYEDLRDLRDRWERGEPVMA